MRIFKICVLLAAASVMVCLWACDDKPTEPAEPDEPEDYYVYFASEVSTNQYFRYHTESGEIESFPAPINTLESAFDISSDGKTMYIRENQGNRIIEYSLDSLVPISEKTVSIQEYSPPTRSQKIITSSNNRYIAVLNGYLHIYNIGDYSLIYRDTINKIGNGDFYQNGNVFFCWIEDTLSVIYGLKVDLICGIEETKWLIPNVSPHQIIPDSDFEKLFIYAHVYNDNYSFQVYNINKDSVEFYKPFCPGLGDMEITLDGRYIIFCQPGSGLIGCPAPRYFTIFNTENNQIDREVDAFIDSLGIVFGVSELCITPDGRHLIGIGYMSNGIFDYNIRSFQFNRFVVTGYIRFEFSLCCQKAW